MTFSTRRTTTALDRIRARRRSATRVIVNDAAVTALSTIVATIDAVKTPNGTTRKIARIAAEGLATA